MKKLKVLKVLLVTGLVLCGFVLPVYADSNNEQLKDTDGYDSTIEVISVRDITEEREESKEKELRALTEVGISGTSRPKEKWNVRIKGECEFSGKASVSNLYSSHVFTGKNKYTYSIDNHRSSELTIKLKKDNLLGTTMQTLKIPANTGKVYTITTNEDFYFMYKAPVHASGYIK